MKYKCDELSKKYNDIATKYLKQFIDPHIAITTRKFKAKSICMFKRLNSDVTIDQFVVVALLNDRPYFYQQELCELLDKNKSNFSRMIDLLEEKQYIKRDVDVKGKRVLKKLTITDKGKELAEKFKFMAEQMNAIAIKGIPEKELNIMKITLEKIRNNLEDY